jgi:hypothetical protein
MSELVGDSRAILVEHKEEIEVDLSKFIIINCVKRSLLDLLPLGHFQLSARKKTHFLGNDA